MFQLSREEIGRISQSVTSLSRLKFSKQVRAFTEQGVAMLSSILNSERTVQVNIAIMRTFVQLRRLMDSNADLARKIERLEKKYDEKFATVFPATKQLLAPIEPAKKRTAIHT